ncbi:hypothetical protein SEA_REYNAULD_103 [Rhodococcus phage Reynauld]|uniref:Uncharacterized protein n=1 Tax=Rhodococcus phage Reynauld TaxID=3062845 RepID=A0ACD4UJT4_9CAUD|nr:hypothetical protein SEA_REYNAULD_103 [Rhodococcus phage Reynauld]
MASIEVHTLANTITLPYVTADAVPALHVPSKLGKRDAADFVCVHVLAWLAQHEADSLNPGHYAASTTAYRIFTIAAHVFDRLAASRRPAESTLRKSAAGVLDAWHAADAAQRADVLAVRTAPSAGGDDAYSIAAALLDPADALASHLENVRDAVASEADALRRGRIDAAEYARTMGHIAATLAPWAPVLAAGTDGADTATETKAYRRQTRALAGLTLALGVDSQTHGKYVGNFWHTDGAALYGAIVDAIQAHADGRGTGRGACRVCDRKGTVVDGRCADCERAGAERPASETVTADTAARFPVGATVWHRDSAAVIAESPQILDTDAGRTERADWLVIEYRDTGRDAVVHVTEVSHVCSPCGARVAEHGDLCPSCADAARANELYFKLHNNIGDRAEHVAVLRAMGAYQEACDRCGVDLDAPGMCEECARPATVSIADVHDHDGRPNGLVRVECSACDTQSIYAHRWHAADAAHAHATGTAHAAAVVIDPMFPDTHIGLETVVSPTGVVLTYDTGRKVTASGAVHTHHALRVPSYLHGDAAEDYAYAAAVARGDAGNMAEDGTDGLGNRERGVVARVLGVQDVTEIVGDADGTETRHARRVVAYETEYDAGNGWRVYGVYLYRGDTHYPIGRIVTDAADTPLHAWHDIIGSELPGDRTAVDLPDGTDASGAIAYVVGAERKSRYGWTIEQDHTTVGACTDCYFAIVNGDEPTDMDDAELEEWRARVDHFYRSGRPIEHVTPGHFHDADCWHDGRDCDDDCDCERTDFSPTPCGVCGNTDAGTRDDVTAWFI